MGVEVLVVKLVAKVVVLMSRSQEGVKKGLLKLNQKKKRLRRRPKKELLRLKKKLLKVKKKLLKVKKKLMKMRKKLPKVKKRKVMPPQKTRKAARI